MDNFDLKTPVQPNTNDLQAQFDQLRQLITSVLILVIVISGTLNIYLLRQWQSSRKDLAAVRPQASQMITDYTKVRGPAMGEFVNKLAEYARSHADFVPILAKYNIRPAGVSNAPAAAAPKK
jgi:hypothetical protein